MAKFLLANPQVAYFNDQTLRVTAETAEAINDLASWEQKLKSNAKALVKLSEVTKIYNDENLLTGVVLKGLNEEGKKYTNTLQRNIKANGEYGKSFEQATKRVVQYGDAVNGVSKVSDKLARQQERDKRTASAQFFQRDVFRQFGGIPGDASGTQKAAIEGAVSSASKLIERGVVTRQTFAKVFAEIKQGKTEFIGLELEASKAINKIINAFDRLQEKAKVKTPAQLLREQRTTDFLNLQTALIGRLGTIPDKALPQQRIQAQTALNSVASVIKAGLSPDKFLEVFDAIKGGSTQVFTGLEGQAATSSKRLLNIYQNFGEQAQEIAKPVLITWRGLARIFAVQAFHQAFSTLLFSMNQTIDKATKLSISMSEIQTISQSAAKSTQAWGKSLKDLSNSFGLEIADVATAAYEALSNQVTNAANVTQFLGTSASFARTTNSTLADSVNLLSSAVNSYKEEGLTAQRASEVLFTTIDLGRIKANELANTFGNVLPSAVQLGISFEEINATLSALTRQGIQVDTAMTLTNNIILKLIKPTEEMKALLAEWGVNSGSAAVATFGFTGILERLNKELEKGGPERLADLASDLRAIRFAFSATGQGLDEILSDLDTQVNKSAEIFENAKKIALESPGFKFQQQLQEFKNTFLFSFGENTLNALVKFTSSIGGIGNVLNTIIQPLQTTASILIDVAKNVGILLNPLVQATRNLGGTTAAVNLLSVALTALSFKAIANSVLYFSNALRLHATKSVVAYTISLRSMTLANAATIASLRILSTGVKGLSAVFAFFGLALNPITATLAAVAAAISTVLFLDNKAHQRRLANVEEFSKRVDIENQKISDILITELNRQVDADKKAYNERIKSLRQFVATRQIELNKLIEQNGVREGNKDKTVGTTLAGESLAAIREKFVGTNANTEKDIENLVKELELSAQSVTKINNKFLNKEFDRLFSKGNLTQQLQLVETRIQQLENQAIALFNVGNITEAREAIEEIHNVIDKLNKDTEKTFQSILQSTEKSIEKLRDVDLGKSRKSLLQQASNKEQEALKFFDTGNIEEAAKLFSEVENILESAADREEDFNKKLRQLGIESGANSAKRFGNELLNERLNKIGKFTPVDTAKLQEKAFKVQLDFEAKIQDSLTKKLDLSKAQQDSLNGINQKLLDIDSVQDNITKKVRQQVESFQEIRTILKEQQTNLAQLFDQNLPSRIFNPGLRASLTRDFDALSGERERLLNSDLFLKLDELQKKFSEQGTNPDTLKQTVQEFQNLLKTSPQFEQYILHLRDFSLHLSEISGFEFDKTRSPLFQLDEALKNIFAGDVNAKTTVDAITQNIDKLQELIKSGGETTTEFNKFIDSREKFLAASKNPGAGISLEGLTGSFKELAEHVNNSNKYIKDFEALKIDIKFAPDLLNNVRKLREDLQAIKDLQSTGSFNSKVTSFGQNRLNTPTSPVVNNTQVGDINFNVEGGENLGRESLEQIGNYLRRAIRSGTLRLN